MRLVATHPERNRSARIQGKSRWCTGAQDFPIQNFGYDFVVAAFLNRGSKDGRKEVMAPRFYVLPIAVVRPLPRTANWKKVSMRHVPPTSKISMRHDTSYRISSLLLLNEIGIARGKFEELETHQVRHPDGAHLMGHRSEN